MTLDTRDTSPATLTSALDSRAQEFPERVAYRFLKDGEHEVGQLTFGELRSRALRVAVHLTSLNAPGERAILLFPQGFDFIVAFFGCLYAGVIAVPASASNRKRGLEVVRRIAADCDATWLLSTGDILEQFRDDRAGCATLARLSCLDTEAFQNGAQDDWVPPQLDADETALLQYTSGATAAPRGVMVTHANLAHNHRQVALCLGSDETTTYVSWLPMFHDMGLGIALQAVWVGVPCILMSPRAFVQEPRRWLAAISRYRATCSGGPDFAFELCVRKLGQQERAGLDLSCWRVAYNGSEPVNAATLERFGRAFAEVGFRHQAFQPVYGLAEATLLVSSEPPGEAPIVRHFSGEALERGLGVRVAAGAGRALVSCGRPWLEATLAIVDPHAREACAEGRVGEIWVCSPSVAAGYWNREPETRAAFFAATARGAGSYLRTGDLGFIDEGRLFVTGRARDLIVVKDQSHYPQDIEATVSASHPALVPHGCAAFSLPPDQGGGLVLVQEVARSAFRTLSADDVMLAIRRAALREHALEPQAIVLLKPATLPRTTSGKVRRSGCRAAYLERSLSAVASWIGPVTPAAPIERGPSSDRERASARADRLIDWLRRQAADLIACHVTSENSSLPGSLLRDFAKQGLLGLQVEQRYGGLGLGHLDTGRVLEQLAAIDFVMALYVGINNYLGIGPVARHGSAALKAWLLPGLVHGEELASFAFAEPGSATPVNGFAARLRGESAERWRLSGAKYLDGVADGASVVTVFVSHKDPLGTSAFVVAGNEVRRHRVAEGIVRAELGFTRDTIELDGLTVGRENLLANLGDGLEIAREAMMHTRLAMAAACIGGMKRCAQLVARSSLSGGMLNGKRTPNPVTLSRLGSVKARIAALECLVQRSARAIDSEQRVPLEAFIACKLLGPELLLRSIDDLLHLGVPLSAADSQRISRLHRDAGLLQNFDGASETAAELAGCALLDGGGSLARLATEVFVAPSAALLGARVVETVQLRMTKLHGALARRAQRWAHTRAGELGSWVALLAALEGSLRDAPSEELTHAHAWAEAQFEQALSSVRYGTPSEAAAVDASDVAATFATYASTIGELEL